ncbi:MAG TPA: hypothetical protein VM327_03215 [Candidatus Thermoplasmatota archaeon]|nr:hypothetical protein [Candidatus Thermoplasmatota archaeon]
MLQVNTGRFFTACRLQPGASRGVLYSNFHWVGKLRTPIGTIESTHLNNDSYVHDYVQQMQADEVIVRLGDDELNRDLCAILNLLLPGFFDPEANTLESWSAKTPVPAGAARSTPQTSSAS